MIYQLYQAQADLLQSLRQIARFGASLAKLMEAGPATPPLLHHLRASWSLFAEAGLTHQRPSFRIDEVNLGNQVVAVTEEAADDTPFGTLLHFRKDSRGGAAARAAGGADVRTLRNAAAPHRRGDAAGTRHVHHRLEERARYPVGRRRLRVGRLRCAYHPLPRSDGPGRASCRGVPAGGSGPRRGGADGRGRQPRPAAQHDADGRTDRHQGQSDQGQRAGPIAADLLVRKEPDRHGALGLPRRASPRLSGLPAARRLHQHESRPPCDGAPGAVP